MKMITPTCIAIAASLISTSAFAGSNADAPSAQFSIASLSATSTVHEVKPAVLINANPHASATTKRRIVRIIKTPVEMPIARDASMAANSQFVYKYGKNTVTKTFRPSVTKSASMPNLFKN